MCFKNKKLPEDEQVKSDKRFSLMGPMRRKYASVDSLWRSAVHLVLEQCHVSLFSFSSVIFT